MNNRASNLVELLNVSSREEIESIERIDEFIRLLDSADVFPGILMEFLFSRGFSNKQLARRISVAPTAVSNWLAGSRLPDFDTLHLLMSSLDLSLEEKEYLLIAYQLSRASREAWKYLKDTLAVGDIASAEEMSEVIRHHIELLNSSLVRSISKKYLIK